MRVPMPRPCNASAIANATSARSEPAVGPIEPGKGHHPSRHLTDERHGVGRVRREETPGPIPVEHREAEEPLVAALWRQLGEELQQGVGIARSSRSKG